MAAEAKTAGAALWDECHRRLKELDPIMAQLNERLKVGGIHELFAQTALLRFHAALATSAIPDEAMPLVDELQHHVGIHSGCTRG